MWHLPSYRTAREIIDWSNKGKSIFNRKRPLAPHTMQRIMNGLKKFSGIPFIVGAGGPSGQGRPSSVDAPLQTVLAENHRCLAEPFLVKLYGTCDSVSVDLPVPTITSSGQHIGVAEPFIVPVNHGDDLRVHSLQQPFPTITTVDAWAIAEPFLLSYYNRRGLHRIGEPLPAITTKERFGMVVPLQDGYAVVDVLFRMLSPDELARAHSLDGYKFTGSREEVVKQIGNSVPRRLAKALCYSALAQ